MFWQSTQTIWTRSSWIGLKFNQCIWPVDGLQNFPFGFQDFNDTTMTTTKTTMTTTRTIRTAILIIATRSSLVGRLVCFLCWSLSVNIRTIQRPWVSRPKYLPKCSWWTNHRHRQDMMIMRSVELFTHIRVSIWTIIALTHWRPFSVCLRGTDRRYTTLESSAN